MKLRFFSQLLIALLLSIQGCSPSAELMTTNAIDPAGGLGREDYLALRNREPALQRKGKKAKDIPPIPKILEEEADLSPRNPFLDKVVSVSVTDSVPVREILLELVRKTGANLELDPRVHGSVIISAQKQPLEQILKRICSMANLRYTADDAFIRIEPDEPYQKSYRLDYLSLARHASSNTSISTNVFDVDVSSGSGSSASNRRSSSAAENNSSARVSGVSEADFWSETERSVEQILGAKDPKGGGKHTYSLNKQAGIVTIYGTQKQHDAVSDYFIKLRRKSSAQVLIDARIIEVELNEAYQSGIDWSGLFKNTVGVASSFGTQRPLGANGFFTTSVSGGNLGGIINLVQSFGTTRVLSAPRVTVLNNQTAVMKVATNQVYFITEAQFTTTTNANGATITTNPVYTSTPRTVPVGLVMTVQPSIDAANNRVTMTLRPTISRIVGEVSDPSIGLNAAVSGVTALVDSKIPVLAVREMDSVIQLRSGEIAVMGGLMQDSSINMDRGVPGLADISVVGNLFKSRDNNGKTSELVVLLRATISDQPFPDESDGDLYRYYNRDPRPIEVPQSAPSLSLDESIDDFGDDFDDDAYDPTT